MFVALAANPDFEFVSERFLFNGEERRRTIAIRGPLTTSFFTIRNKATTVSLARRSASGVIDPRPFNHESGHIIGLGIGGPDCPENVVPMTGGVNRSTYWTMERKINALAATASSPKMLVVIQYHSGPGADPRIPIGFSVYYKPELPDLGKLLPWGPATTQIRNVPSNSLKIELSSGYDLGLREGLLMLRRQVVRDGWKLEDVSADAADWARRGLLPRVADRPYAVLDRLAHDRRWAGMQRRYLPYNDFGATISPGREFAESQRRNIVFANQIMQADGAIGECRSDDPTDPIRHTLTQFGTDNGAQIDHIHPKASSGPNVYSNAQVLSAKQNRVKSRS